MALVTRFQNMFVYIVDRLVKIWCKCILNFSKS